MSAEQLGEAFGRWCGRLLVVLPLLFIVMALLVRANGDTVLATYYMTWVCALLLAIVVMKLCDLQERKS